MGKKVLLMILDGWGIGKKDSSNAIYTQGSPNIDALAEKYPHSQLMTCGEYVGLPDGQMGNSEVGHLNIGAGRVVDQDLVRINKTIKEKRMLENKEIKAAYDYVKKSGKALHLMGLCSTGGVHSTLPHLYAFLEIAKEYGLEKVYLHCFMDGRDTDPRSGLGFIRDIEAKMAETTGKIATVEGRFYAMDRDKRWERIKLAYDLLVNGKGTPFTSATAAVEASYKRHDETNGEVKGTDEFIEPVVITNPDGSPVATIQNDDAVIFFNYRNDRAREITHVLTQEDMPEQGMHKLNLHYCCLTPYDANFKGVHILFDKEVVPNTLGEIVGRSGKKQLRIAETEKYAHVTFFFNGGREAEFENESRILINSPKVKTYDLKPEMSAHEVTDALVNEINQEKFDLIILNYANGDMVGHTGVFDAIKVAVKTIDGCVATTVAAAQAHGYTVLICADHGNADHAVKDNGQPDTAHSLNPVPFIVVDEDVKSVKNGKLADIAPTILKLMDIEKPAEMTGDCLID